MLEAEGDGGGGMDALVLDLVTRAGIFDIRLVNRKSKRESQLVPLLAYITIFTTQLDQL